MSDDEVPRCLPYLGRYLLGTQIHRLSGINFQGSQVTMLEGKNGTGNVFFIRSHRYSLALLNYRSAVLCLLRKNEQKQSG